MVPAASLGGKSPEPVQPPRAAVVPGSHPTYDGVVPDGEISDPVISDPVISDPVISDTAISDAELSALALAADPDAPIDPDAIPFGARGAGTDGESGLLPGWYAPGGILPPSRSRSRRRVVVAVILALVVVNGAGLCVTYGVPEIAW